MKKIYTIILLTALTASNLIGQCMLTPLSLTQRVNNSNVIVEGTVISKKPFWNATHDYIYTSNLIQVKQILKGNSHISFVEVITAGGEIDVLRVVVDPALQLNQDQEGVFMLTPRNYSSQFGYTTYEAYGDDQGFVKFNIKENSATDPFNKYEDINADLYKAIGDVMNTTLPFYSGATHNNQGKLSDLSQLMAVTSIAPTNIPAGTFSVLTINGSGFGVGPSATNYVEWRNADDGGATFIGAHQSQYLSWTPTQIQVYVPTRTNGGGTAGTGQVRVTTTTGSTLSATSLTVNYGHLNVISPGSPTTAASVVYNTRHVNDNASGGYTWQYFTGFAGNAPAVSSFTRAIKTWTCTTYINWIIGANSAINVAAADGVNIVRFDIGAELPAGVLGRCTSYFGGCGSNPNMNWYVSELDIVFDDVTNWQYGPANPTAAQMDFESVAVHELGHGHQLSHVINAVDVMHFSIANGQNKRALNVDDINGGTTEMTRNLSGGVCAQPVMTQLSSASCTTLVPTATFVITPTLVCTGQVVTLTDQSTNGPITWTWTLTGGAPATSNAQNPTVTYATAGTKTITLACSNSNGPSTPFSQTISVVASPTVAVTSASICPAKVATLTASGAVTYTWNPGNLVGTTQTLSPASTQVYNVVGSNGTCTNSSTGTVTVYPGAFPGVSNSTICAGFPTVKTATGATTYTWNPGNLTGPTQTLSPVVTTTYTVIGTVGTCTGQTTFVITTTTVLTGMAVTPLSSTVCVGSPTVLTASGATTYTWNPGNLNGATQTLSPGSTTTYTVGGTTGGCSGQATCVVNTTTVLTGVSISPSNLTLCVGQTTVLTASGATTYSWNTTATTNTILASQATTTVYVVTGTTGGCSGTANSTVNISTCAGINPSGSELVSSIYPNPTQGTLVMKFSNTFNGSVVVYNAIGQLVMEKKLTDKTEVELNISEQADGVYMMKVRPDNGSEKIFKVIKQ